jgi:hypothetical protein
VRAVVDLPVVDGMRWGRRGGEAEISATPQAWSFPNMDDAAAASTVAGLSCWSTRK